MIRCSLRTVSAVIAAAAVLPSAAAQNADKWQDIENVVHIGSRVRLLSDEALFREAFLRFPNDELNGLSPAKLERLGWKAEVLEKYADRTLTFRFEDGVQLDMPSEAIEAIDTHVHDQSSTRVERFVLPRTCIRMVSCTDLTATCRWALLQKCADALDVCQDLLCEDSWVRTRCAKTCGACTPASMTSTDHPSPRDKLVYVMNVEM